MQVPIRKGGEFTHIAPDPNLTQSKYDELTDKLARLKKILPELIREVQRHAELGDFSENAAYQLAKGKLRSVNQKILDLEDHLKQAVIIKPVAGGSVQLGSVVVVNLDGQEKTFAILGSAEVDLANNVISHNSPIGSALLGKGAGDKFKIKLATKELDCEIIKVE